LKIRASLCLKNYRARNTKKIKDGSGGISFLMFRHDKIGTQFTSKFVGCGA